MRKIARLLIIPMMIAALSGCGNANNNNQTNTDEKYHIYELAVSSGYEGTYEEWLETIKGKDGKDGTSLLSGSGAPSSTIGKVGDSYIDLDSWDFYVKDSNGWIKKGNIKGEKGEDAPIENEQGLAFYLLDDGTYGVGIGTAKYLTDIVVPSKYKGKAVTKVVSYGFMSGGEFDDSSFKTVTLPNSIVEIGSGAFSCETLEKVSLPSSIKKIGDGAFYSYNFKEIKYDGTMEQFNKIEFGDSWLGFCTVETDENGNKIYQYLKGELTFKFKNKNVSFNSLFNSIEIQFQLTYPNYNYKPIYETIGDEFSVSRMQGNFDTFYCYESTIWFGGFKRQIYDLRVSSSKSNLASPAIEYHSNYTAFVLGRDFMSTGTSKITISNDNTSKVFNYNVIDDIAITVAQAKTLNSDNSINQITRLYYSITGYVSNYEQNLNYGGNYWTFLLKDTSDSSDYIAIKCGYNSPQLQDLDYVKVTGQLLYDRDGVFYGFYEDTQDIKLISHSS